MSKDTESLRGARYTPAVKRLAGEIRKLTTAELLALREALKGEWDIGEPGAGVREPRRPGPHDDSFDAIEAAVEAQVPDGIPPGFRPGSW